MTNARIGHSTCPRCGTTFVCGNTAGDANCWCVKLPAIAPAEPDCALCLCPTCLRRQIEAADADPPR